MQVFLPVGVQNKIVLAGPSCDNMLVCPQKGGQCAHRLALGSPCYCIGSQLQDAWCAWCARDAINLDVFLFSSLLWGALRDLFLSIMIFEINVQRTVVSNKPAVLLMRRSLPGDGGWDRHGKSVQSECLRVISFHRAISSIRSSWPSTSSSSCLLPLASSELQVCPCILCVLSRLATA